METILRQGDVCLVRIESADLGDPIPRDDRGRIVLAHGEVTGHAHAIYNKSAMLFSGKARNADVFLRVVKPVSLRHEEHSRVRVPPGDYHVMRQSEYTPEEIRYVAD